MKNQNRLKSIKYFIKPKNIFLFIKALFSLLIIKALLAWFSLPQILKVLEPKRKINPDNQEVDSIIKFTNFIIFHLFRSPNPCLLRSLFLFRYLKMMGKDIKIVLGVKPEGGKLKGHAWLIVDGNPFPDLNNPAEEYGETLIYP